MKITFSDEGDMTHCEIIHEGKSGKGSVNKAAITGLVKRAIGKHGARKVAVALGACRDEGANYRMGPTNAAENEHIPGIIFGIADAINNEAKCQALQKAATSMGWSPFSVLKKAAWDYNPVVFAAKKAGQFGYGGLKAINPFKRKKGGGAPAGGPEGKEDSTPEEDADEADASSGYELMQKWDIMGCDTQSGWIDGDNFVQGDLDGELEGSDSDEPMAGAAGSIDNMFDIGDQNDEPMAGDLSHHNQKLSGLEAMVGGRLWVHPAHPLHPWNVRKRLMRGKPPTPSAGDAEIGFAPLLAYQAYRHKQELAKISKSGNPRAANAAKSLHKAKSGDKKEQAKIKAINARAKQGDPKAKDAMKRLKAVDALANKGARGPLGRLVHDGII